MLILYKIAPLLRKEEWSRVDFSRVIAGILHPGE